jgi:hypothetical protein
MRGTSPVRGKHICPRDVRQPESEHHLSRSPSPSWLGCFKQRLQFKVPRHVTVGCSRDEQRPKRGCLISLLMRRRAGLNQPTHLGIGHAAGCQEAAGSSIKRCGHISIHPFMLRLGWDGTRGLSEALTRSPATMKPASLSGELVVLASIKSNHQIP